MDSNIVPLHEAPTVAELGPTQKINPHRATYTVMEVARLLNLSRSLTYQYQAGGLRFHDLRHSYGTWLADDGVPVNKVQKVMGHENVTTTLQLYVRKRDDPSAILNALDDDDDPDGGAASPVPLFAELQPPTTNRRSPSKQRVPLEPAGQGDSFLVWAMLGSNQRPLRCERSALPLS